ncbi:hypothetical protein HDU97_007184 [Phlyctochytrium planicorne]|nr:hypothetical protein HDU97_007184 [Phlyctochytrium planicorne]
MSSSLAARALAIPLPSTATRRKDASSSSSTSSKPKSKILNFIQTPTSASSSSTANKRKRSSSEAEESHALTLPKASSKKAKEPEVVVFSETKLDRLDMPDAREKRAFLSSDINKLVNDGTKTKPYTSLSKEEEEQDKSDDKNDRELMQLLKSSRLLEDIAISENDGKDRRAFLERKMIELGAKDLKKHQKAPPPIRTGIIKAEKVRAQKRLQTAKEMGLYHSSLRTQIMNGDNLPPESKKKKKNVRELTGSTGTFSGGVLHVPKSVIAETNRAGSAGRMRKGKSGGPFIPGEFDGPRRSGSGKKGGGKRKGGGGKKRK